MIPILKAKIILALAEIGLLICLYSFGFLDHCIKTGNYILLALPIIAGLALLDGTSRLIMYIRKNFR